MYQGNNDDGSKETTIVPVVCVCEECDWKQEQGRCEMRKITQEQYREYTRLRRMFAEKSRTSIHHMVPKSRAHELSVYVHDKRNIKETTSIKHEAFNILFGSNATPEDALLIIANQWTPELSYYASSIKNKATLAFLVAVKDPVAR